MQNHVHRDVLYELPVYGIPLQPCVSGPCMTLKLIHIGPSSVSLSVSFFLLCVSWSRYYMHCIPHRMWSHVNLARSGVISDRQKFIWAKFAGHKCIKPKRLQHIIRNEITIFKMLYFYFCLASSLPIDVISSNGTY